MSWKVYTLDELHELGLAQLRGKLPEANLAPKSPYWLKVRAVAAIVFAQQAQTLRAKRAILASTCDVADLPEHSRVVFGDDDATLPAARARGKVIAISSSAGDSFAEGDLLTHASGRQYRVTAPTTTVTVAYTGSVGIGSSLARVILAPNATGLDVDDLVSVGSSEIVRAIRDVLPEIGTPYAIDLSRPLVALPVFGTPVAGVTGVVVEVEAVEAGAAGNLLPGDVLTWDSPPGNVEDAASVVEMTGGGDAETAEELRRRILAWLAERPGSGNRSDMREWARATPGVRIEDACVFMGYRGIGTVDIVPIGVSGARLTGTQTNAAILEYVRSQASELDDITVRSMIDAADPSEGHVAFDMQIDVAEGYEPDWSKDLAYEIDSSTTTTITFTATPTAIQVGLRCLAYVAAGVRPGLYQVTVTQKVGNVITYEPELPGEPLVGSEVFSGGPCTQGVIDAVNAYFDELGPSDVEGFARYPGDGTAWDWVFRSEAVSAAALAVEGVQGAIAAEENFVAQGAQFERPTLGQWSIRHVEIV